MSLRVYNISKGVCEEEKVCAERLMRFLYGARDIFEGVRVLGGLQNKPLRR